MINLKTHLCLAAIITTTQNSPPIEGLSPALTRYSTIRHSILAPKIITDTQSTTLQFSKEVAGTRIDDNKMLVSFDVVFLLTAIPSDKESDYIEGRKVAVTSFHNTLKSIDPNISFTMEHDSDGMVSFL